MNYRRYGFVLSAVLVASLVSVACEQSAFAQVVVGDGFIEIGEGLDEDFLLSVDEIIVLGRGLNAGDEWPQSVAECGEWRVWDRVKPVEVILITREGKVEVATLWASLSGSVFLNSIPAQFVTSSRSASLWWWQNAGDPYSNCFDAVVFDLTPAYQ